MKERDLFDRIASFRALLEASDRAAKGKRVRRDVAAFLTGQEFEVLRLEQELRDGTYRPGRYRKIEVFEPKHRIVSAAPFRDRVVHHALYSVYGPLFERGFIFDSYANRTGKGTHRAVARYESFRDRYRHVLRCDIFRRSTTRSSSTTSAGGSPATRPWTSLTASLMRPIPRNRSTCTFLAMTCSLPWSAGAVSRSATSPVSSSPMSIWTDSIITARKCFVRRVM